MQPIPNYDKVLDPPDDEPVCTGHLWSCGCAACLQEWTDKDADEAINDRDESWRR